MMRARPGSERRGYAMVLVCLFLILMLSLLGATYREVTSTLQIEMARSRRVSCNAGSLEAAAWAMQYLETTALTSPLPSAPFSIPHNAYTVTFTPPSVGTAWTVDVVLTATLP